jgi:flagellar motor protein MotB
MARKKNNVDAPPSKAYLVSFGDTMTTLLAFFIVLCSLAEEQSGANLHAGTGSFVAAIDSFGMPGTFSGESSANAIPRNETSPLYIAEDPDGKESEKDPSGPDDTDDGMRVIDREADQLQRFLNEIERLATVEPQPTTKGAVVFDFFENLNPEPPLLPEGFTKVYRQFVPVLQSDSFRVEIVVWATTPSRLAWQRAAENAGEIVVQVANDTGLDAEQRGRVRSFGRPWPFSDDKRPTFSVIVRKVETTE